MEKLLAEIEELRQEVVENTQVKCVWALMLSEDIDFDTAVAKLQLTDAATERIRERIKTR